MKQWLQTYAYRLVVISLIVLVVGAYMTRGGHVGRPIPMDHMAVSSFSGAPAMMEKSSRAMAPMMEMVGTANAAEPAIAPAEKRTLAYAHSLTIEVENYTALKTVFEKVKAACVPAQHACQLLNATMQNDDVAPYASLTMRVAPDGVQWVIDQASGDNAVIKNRNTNAEDLSSQITDTDRRLAMYENQFERMNALYNRPGAALEDLIRASQELSNIQNNIETLKASKERIAERVDQENITITFQVPPQAGAALNPLQTVFKEFGVVVATSTADFIRFVAGFIPWGAALAIMLYCARGFMTGRWWFARRK